MDNESRQACFKYDKFPHTLTSFNMVYALQLYLCNKKDEKVR